MECEDCGINTSTVYCLGCKKHMCLKCVQGKHPNTHQVVSAESSVLCPEHHQPCDLFCEDCDKLLCSLCTKLHHSSYHSIQSLVSTFRKKFSQLHSILDEKGYSKKNLIELQIEYRKNQLQDLIREYSSLEKEIHDTHSAMSKRLELHVAPILKELKESWKEASEDIEGLNNALSLIESSSKFAFLSKYKSMINSILTIKTKGLKPERNIDFSLVPVELQEWNERARVCSSLESLNLKKNEILWDVWTGTVANTDAAVAREVAQWSRLTDQFLERVKKMAQACFFCKLPLNGENVNSECRMNSRELAVYSSDTKVPSRHLGSGYHYFVKK